MDYPLRQAGLVHQKNEMPNSDAFDPQLRLDARSGLPEDWRFLLADYPRETWTAHTNLGEHTRFWLSIHRYFRITGVQLASRGDDYREGRISSHEFRTAIAPRLQQFLETLDHHHRIEDHVFFPKFMAADRRFVKGIELLEADHSIVDAEVHQMINTANDLLRTPADDGETLKRVGMAFAGSSDRIVKLLGRHLDDEEEIVVPLMLDRGEGELMGG